MERGAREEATGSANGSVNLFYLITSDPAGDQSGPSNVASAKAK